MEARLRDAQEVLNLKMSGVIRSATAARVEVPDLRSCGSAIAAIVEEIGREKDVTIGRTSFRLRNPKNVPPEWAESLVQAKTGEMALFRHEDGRMAALYPLRTQMGCLKCHGDPEVAPPSLKAKLLARYPQDESWGFEYPGIRGYIWVETLPAAQR
ncbi:MAG: DUF3365 domain-containing protein [Planctomycetota bacterium]